MIERKHVKSTLASSWFRSCWPSTDERECLIDDVLDGGRRS
jgi:hypothetical protein